MSDITPPLSCDQKGRTGEKVYRCDKCRAVFAAPWEGTDPLISDETLTGCPECGHLEYHEINICPLCGKEEPGRLPMCRECAINEIERMEKEAKTFGRPGRTALLKLLREAIDG